MKMKRNMMVLLLIVAAVCLVFGCAERTTELLAEDYQKMSNDDLLRYFYRLDDEIEKQEKQSGPRIGIGIGSIGSRTGAGVGISSDSTGHTADELRERRIEVRLELKKRGLNP
jgi:hypothetical protein